MSVLDIERSLTKRNPITVLPGLELMVKGENSQVYYLSCDEADGRSLPLSAIYHPSTRDSVNYVEINTIKGCYLERLNKIHEKLLRELNTEPFIEFLVHLWEPDKNKCRRASSRIRKTVIPFLDSYVTGGLITHLTRKDLEQIGVTIACWELIQQTSRRAAQYIFDEKTEDHQEIGQFYLYLAGKAGTLENQFRKLSVRMRNYAAEAGLDVKSEEIVFPSA